MTPKIELKLKPFQTPSGVTVDMPARSQAEGLAPLVSFTLQELSPETLAELCDVFRAEVFDKALKTDPAKGSAP